MDEEEDSPILKEKRKDTGKVAGVKGRGRGGGVNSAQTFSLRESKEFSRETPPTPKRSKHILK